VALIYTISAVVAVQLGEADEEKVEKVISEKVIEEHEAAATRSWTSRSWWSG